MTLNPGLTLTQTHTQSANEMQRTEHKKKKKKLPHTQTNAGMCTHRALFKSSESRTVLQQDNDGDRQSLLIYPKGNVK